MHSTQIARLAAHVADRATPLARLKCVTDPAAITNYWVASRKRLDLWHHGLARHSYFEAAGRPLALRVWWKEHAAMIEEILVSEMLTRVFAAFASVSDATANCIEMSPITHSIFQSHLEARNRALQMILFGRGATVSQTVGLNRLRRTSERWTDLLIGQMAATRCDAILYGFDPQRVEDQAVEYRSIHCERELRGIRTFIDSSLVIAVRSRTSSVAALPHANAQVARAVLGFFAPTSFDSIGLPISDHRIRANVALTQRAETGDARPVIWEHTPDATTDSDVRSSPPKTPIRWLL